MFFRIFQYFLQNFARYEILPRFTKSNTLDQGGAPANLEREIGFQTFFDVLADRQFVQVLHIGQGIEEQDALDEQVGMFHLADGFFVCFGPEPGKTPIFIDTPMQEILVDRGQFVGQNRIEDLDDCGVTLHRYRPRWAVGFSIAQATAYQEEGRIASLTTMALAALPLLRYDGLAARARPWLRGKPMNQSSDEDKLKALEARLRAARRDEPKPGMANHESGSESAFRMVGLLVGPILMAVAAAWVLNHYFGGGGKLTWLWILAPFLGLGLGIYGVIGEGRRLTRIAQAQETNTPASLAPAALGLDVADHKPQEQALPSDANAVSGQRREHANGQARGDDADEDEDEDEDD